MRKKIPAHLCSQNNSSNRGRSCADPQCPKHSTWSHRTEHSLNWIPDETKYRWLMLCWFIQSLSETLLTGKYTCVGVMWLISSAASCFSTVVFPALSKPSNSRRTSWSGDCFSLRRMDNSPCDFGTIMADEMWHFTWTAASVFIVQLQNHGL